MKGTSIKAVIDDHLHTWSQRKACEVLFDAIEGFGSKSSWLKKHFNLVNLEYEYRVAAFDYASGALVMLLVDKEAWQRKVKRELG